jgi:peroxiredoxin
MGLAIGTAAPAFQAADLDGRAISLADLLHKRLPVVLLFTDPNCPTCTEMLPEVGQWQQKFETQVTVAVLSVGSVQENKDKVTTHHVRNVILQREHEVADLYKVVGTPTGLLVRADGSIGSELMEGADTIRQLVSIAETQNWGNDVKTMPNGTEPMSRGGQARSRTQVLLDRSLSDERGAVERI